MERINKKSSHILNRELIKSNKYLIGLYLFLSLYYPYVQKDYFYQGFNFTWNTPILVIGLILLIISISIVSKIRIQFLKFLGTTYLIFGIFPAIILFQFHKDHFGIMLAHMLVLFAFLPWKKKMYFTIKLKNFPNSLLTIFSFLIVLIFSTSLFSNINIENILLQEIAESRSIQTQNFNPIKAYLYSFASKILFPCLLILSLIRKKYTWALLNLFIIILFFFDGGHKSVIFTLFCSLFFYFFPRYSQQNKIILLSFVIVFIPIIGILLDDSSFLASTIIRRIFFIPALLDHYYFEFFFQNHLFWSHSFLGGLIEYPYPSLPAYEIAFTYFGDINQSSNNGIVSDGFMNLGYLGILLNIIILRVYVKILTDLNIDQRFYGLLVPLIFSILSSYLPVVLITHGGIFLLIISFYIHKNESYSSYISSPKR